VTCVVPGVCVGRFWDFPRQLHLAAQMRQLWTKCFGNDQPQAVFGAQLPGGVRGLKIIGQHGLKSITLFELISSQQPASVQRFPIYW
jgi:hypothetical protein